MSFWQAIIGTVTNLGAAVAEGFSETFSWLSKLYTTYTWATNVFLGILWFGVVYVWDGVAWIGTHIPTLYAAVTAGSGISGVQAGGELGQAFAFINAILPLSEFLGFVIFVAPLWMLAVTIRSIKSWIPTVN